MADTVDMIQKKALIKKQPFFSQFSEEEIQVLATLFTEVRLFENDTIVTEGEPVDSVFLIVEGVADVRHVRVKDNDLEIESVATLESDESIGLSETGFYSL